MFPPKKDWGVWAAQLQKITKISLGSEALWAWINRELEIGTTPHGPEPIFKAEMIGVIDLALTNRWGFGLMLYVMNL